MNDTDTDLRFRRMRELALRARHTGKPQFTAFLEPPDEIAARAAANGADTHVTFFGGFPDAERRMAGFADAAIDGADFPIAAVLLKWNAKFSSPEHRDLLGALMGLGIERDSAGDIAFGADDGTAYLFVREEISAYVCGNLESAGRASITAEVIGAAPVLRPPSGITVRITVSGERLDAILAEGLNLSRAQAQKLIAQGLVKRNHAMETRGDLHLTAGDLLSVRGYGRMRVQALDGITRKGRLSVRLFKYT